MYYCTSKVFIDNSNEQIMVECACNNVVPLRYSLQEYDYSHEENFGERLVSFIQSFVEGNFHFDFEFNDSLFKKAVQEASWLLKNITNGEDMYRSDRKYQTRYAWKIERAACSVIANKYYAVPTEYSMATVRELFSNIKKEWFTKEIQMKKEHKYHVIGVSSLDVLPGYDILKLEDGGCCIAPEEQYDNQGTLDGSKNIVFVESSMFGYLSGLTLEDREKLNTLYPELKKCPMYRAGQTVYVVKERVLKCIVHQIIDGLLIVVSDDGEQISIRTDSDKLFYKRYIAEKWANSAN